jgi:hypothetical protein
MNLKDIECLFHSPYGPWGLRHRAEKLGNCDYAIFLKTLATQIEKRHMTVDDARVLVDLWRNGKIESAVIMLKTFVESAEKKEKKP